MNYCEVDIKNELGEFSAIEELHIKQEPIDYKEPPLYSYTELRNSFQIKVEKIEEASEEIIIKEENLFETLNSQTFYDGLTHIKLEGELIIHDEGLINLNQGKNISGKKIYNCPHCDYKSISYDSKSLQSNNLKAHILCHHPGQKLYHCYHCNYLSMRFTHLKNHIKVKHLRYKEIKDHNYRGLLSNSKKKTKRYECPNCFLTFISYSMLKQHLSKKHTNVIMYLCYHCDYLSLRLMDLRRHINAQHSTDRSPNIRNIIENIDNKCPYCNYKANYYSTLLAHVTLKHFGVKRYSCTYCDYKSGYSGQMDRHVMARHTSEKPYKCPECDYRAVRKCSLKRHIVSNHTHEFPFQCSHCDYRTSRKSHLNRHNMSFHSKEKMYKCPHCDLRSTEAYLIKNHIKKRHKHIKV